MKFSTFLFIIFPYALNALDLSRQSCLLDSNGAFEITLESCSVPDFRDAVMKIIDQKKQQFGESHCLSYGQEIRLLAQSKTVNPNMVIYDLCKDASTTTKTGVVSRSSSSSRMARRISTFRDVFSQIGFEAQDDEEFFNGGTYLNTEYDDSGSSTTPLSTAASFVSSSYATVMSGPLDFPSDSMEAFEDCDANAVVCCYTADRQADGFGTCTSTAASNECEDADPADNTDICYVDNQVSPFAGQVPSGYSVFPGDSEGPVYCEGFAWSKPTLNEASYRFRGNTLYHVALMENLHNRGYVRAVPGSPMCGCVEKMPVLSDAACTEVSASESFSFSMKQGGEGGVAASMSGMSFRSCPEGSLSAHMAQLEANRKVTPESKALFDSFVVGTGGCDAAITGLLSGRSSGGIV